MIPHASYDNVGKGTLERRVGVDVARSRMEAI